MIDIAQGIKVFDGSDKELLNHLRSSKCLNPLSDGIQIQAVLMGGGIQCLPLTLLKIKLQSHVRGQNGGF